MILDETGIAGALGDIDVAVPSNLVNRVRRGGRRRLVRRRVGAGAVVVAAGAVAVPVAVVVGSGGGSRIEPTQRQHIYPGLYAAPPAPGSTCNGGYDTKATPSDFPDLLLLPQGQPVTVVDVTRDAMDCQAPHVALTAVQLQDGGETFGPGVVVYGPNAPTATEDGAVGPDEVFGGQTGHAPIGGVAALEQTVTQDDETNAYWTEPDGGQWEAFVRGMSQEQAVDLLGGLVLDTHNGTATIPGAAGSGWTIESAVPDVTNEPAGGIDTQWTDPQGNQVMLSVSAQPDTVIDSAVRYGGPIKLFVFRGGTATVSSTAGGFVELTWQAASDVQVLVRIRNATVQEVEQAAGSLTLAAPDDPRLSDYSR